MDDYGEAVFIIREFEVLDNLFTPGELAKMTGLDAGLQRVWRRRGHLPEVLEGHARFTTTDVCRLALVQRLVKFGTPIKLAFDLMEPYVPVLRAHLFYGKPCYHVPWTGGMEDVFEQLYTAQRLAFIEEECDMEVDLLAVCDDRTVERLTLAEIPHCMFEVAVFIVLRKLADEIRAAVDRSMFSVFLREPNE